MKIPGDLEQVAQQVFSAEQLANLELKSAANTFELLLFLPAQEGVPTESVGTQIPVTMFHQTEDYHSSWRNVMRNLKELYELKLGQRK